MIIIPARLQSTRFPKKILADINGLPMVIATAKRVQDVDDVAIATDDESVLALCKKHHFKGILTSDKHTSGTDRINEAAKKLHLSEDEAVVNVQADEPFIEPQIVQKVLEKVKADKEAFMVSCCKKVASIDADDPNLVKVLMDINSYAIYFSRSKIPYDREPNDTYFGHIGIYGFTCKNLDAFCNLPYAPVEHIEKLEQLRAIYSGKKIAMIPVQSESFGIDTKEDLQRALKTLNKG